MASPILFGTITQSYWSHTVLVGTACRQCCPMLNVIIATSVFSNQML